MKLSSLLGLQSPIDIITADVVQNPDLTAVEFSSSWSEPTTNGVFANLGHNIQFTQDSNSPEITTNFPIGQYRFVQTHMHWGNRTGTGSEHRFDGEQTELEIHFVHERISDDGRTDRNGLGVIGVYAEVDEDAPMTDFWSIFNPNLVPASGDNMTIYNFTLSSILPSNLNRSYYYHYGGGLTTPPCTETVQFFLFRQRITVPGAFLNALRTITDDDGNTLSLNYRDLQPINGRVVEVPGSGASAIGASIVLVAAVALVNALSWF